MKKRIAERVFNQEMPFSDARFALLTMAVCVDAGHSLLSADAITSITGIPLFQTVQILTERESEAFCMC